MVEGDTKLVSVGTVKEGNVVVIDGEACKVISIQTSRPGKHGHAKVRLTGVGMIDGKKREVMMPGHDNIPVPIIDKRNAQVLSITGKTANVMDAESYETFDLNIPDELAEQVVEGVTIVYWVILNAKVLKQVKSE